MGCVMLNYVEVCKSKGRIYYYYRRNGKRQKRLPNDPTTMEFVQVYNQVHALFEKSGQVLTYDAESLTALITSFKGSAEFLALKPAVKYLYLLTLDYLQKHLGHLKASGITRLVYLNIRDDMAEMPSKANNFIAGVSRLYGFGIDRGMVQINPVSGIKKLKIGEHRPWTEQEIQDFLTIASPSMSLAMKLALYSGQRLGDVIKMRWNQIDRGGIEVTQQKTGEKLWIPLHTKLSSLLSNVSKSSVMILTSVTGKPFKADHLKHEFKNTSRAAGLPEDCVFHGLRKTAAVMLAEAGCSTEQIKSITGHRTDQMVAHYTKGAQQKVMARAAIERLEFGNRQDTSIKR